MDSMMPKISTKALRRSIKSLERNRPLTSIANTLSAKAKALRSVAKHKSKVDNRKGSDIF